MELTLNRLERLRYGESGALLAACQAPKFFSSRVNFASVNCSQGKSTALTRTFEGGEISCWEGSEPFAPGERNQ